MESNEWLDKIERAIKRADTSWRTDGKDALAIMLTGMGDDGARGMKLLHDGGARTLAQDEASCVVFGMPKEAIRLGAVDEVLPLGRIADAILRFDARG